VFKYSVVFAGNAIDITCMVTHDHTDISSLSLCHTYSRWRYPSSLFRAASVYDIRSSLCYRFFSECMESWKYSTHSIGFTVPLVRLQHKNFAAVESLHSLGVSSAFQCDSTSLQACSNYKMYAGNNVYRMKQPHTWSACENLAEK